MATQETTRPPSIATSLWFVSLPSLEGIEAVTKQADGIELRLDLFPSITLSSLTQYVHCPLLLTLRSKAHGGAFQGSSMEYQQLLFALAELSPFFIDLEYDRDPLFLREIISKYPHIRWVLSYHMTKNKYDLPTLYQQMSRFPAYTYKIAITPKTTTEALQALLFTLHHSNISLICMGDKGSFARILAPLYGNKINFVKHIHSTAEGQLSLQDLSLYRHASFSAKTALYGLIGDPVSHSQGHIHHNTLFAKRNFDALYLKMQVSQEELSSFLPLAWELGFQGLSVTMPLKETILPLLTYVDDGAKKMGSVNTLIRTKRGWAGWNTDGAGALDALAKYTVIAGQHIVILGAGGTARAIAYESIKRGASVFIANRTKEKAQELASLFSCQAGGIEDIPSVYDIIILCSPKIPSNLCSEQLLPGTLAMDVVYVPKETPFLQLAKSRGCRLVYGEEMFVQQAEQQRRLWTLP